MANTKIIFIGSDSTEEHQIEICNHTYLIEILLTTDSGFKSNIYLDVPTAIKFSKVLRHEISKAKQIQESLSNE